MKFQRYKVMNKNGIALCFILASDSNQALRIARMQGRYTAAFAELDCDAESVV